MIIYNTNPINSQSNLYEDILNYNFFLNLEFHIEVSLFASLISILEDEMNSLVKKVINIMLSYETLY